MDKDILKKIEREVQDDLCLLIDIGPKYFLTSQLLELRGRCRQNIKHTQTLRKVSLNIGVAACSFIVVPFLTGVAGFSSAAVLFLRWLPMLFFIFIAFSIWSNLKFKRPDYWDKHLQTINTELLNRKNKTDSAIYN